MSHNSGVGRPSFGRRRRKAGRTQAWSTLDPPPPPPPLIPRSDFDYKKKNCCTNVEGNNRAKNAINIILSQNKTSTPNHGKSTRLSAPTHFDSRGLLQTSQLHPPPPPTKRRRFTRGQTPSRDGPPQPAASLLVPPRRLRQRMPSPRYSSSPLPPLPRAPCSGPAWRRY